jgi:hypothetical protein
MVDVPALLPVTMPVADPTEAMEGADDVHDPPVVLLLSVVVLPTHTVSVPVMPGRLARTVMLVVV